MYLIPRRWCYRAGAPFQTFLAASGDRCLIVVSTSGDTGSAAIQAVRGLDNIDIVVLLPHGRCTEVQELQMTTCIDDNVHIFAGQCAAPISDCGG